MIRSVRARLTVLYAVVLAVVLAVFSGGAYLLLDHRLRAALDETLRSDFEDAEDLARNGWVRPLSTLAPEDDHHHESERWIEVIATDGEEVLRRGPKTILPATSPGLQTVVLPGGEPVRVLYAPYVLSGRRVTIRVARSEAPLRHDLREFLVGLGIALPLAVGLSCAAGYFLAQRTLAPVDRIVERARSITADRLDERLPVENPDDELGRLATTFNDAFARLQRSFQEMRRFTGDAAHELRTPLTALRSVGEVCLRDPERDARDAIGSMLEEVERMTRLVEGLLRLARADEAGEPVALQPTDLGDFVRALVARLGVTATVETDGDVVVSADPDLLAQALGNVIDNAVRQTPDDVAITVRAPGVVAVADRGEGIASEHQERIFERFYRVDEARARTSGGAGLGLAIARRAMEAQGGSIEVESEPGEGALFRLSLPPIGA